MNYNKSHAEYIILHEIFFSDLLYSIKKQLINRLLQDKRIITLNRWLK